MSLAYCEYQAFGSRMLQAEGKDAKVVFEEAEVRQVGGSPC